MSIPLNLLKTVFVNGVKELKAKGLSSNLITDFLNIARALKGESCVYFVGAFRLRRAYQMERFLIAISLLFYEHYTPLYVSDVVALLS